MLHRHHSVPHSLYLALSLPLSLCLSIYLSLTFVPSPAQVTRSHFLGALRGLTPSSQREGINPARPLPPHLSALLSDSLATMSEALQVLSPLLSP